MAIEILRPNANSEASSSGGIVFYPSDVEFADAEILVYEAVADDDATYIEITDLLHDFDGHFDSERLRNNYSKITSFRIVCRIKTAPTSTSLRCRLDSPNSTSSDTFTTIKVSPQSSDWETVYANFETTDIITRIETALKYDATQDLFTVLFGLNTETTTNPDKSTLSLKITQVYVEITYEDDSSNDSTTETIYLKENDAWASIPCLIYQKQNGTWVTADSTILEDGYNFILQELL